MCVRCREINAINRLRKDKWTTYCTFNSFESLSFGPKYCAWANSYYLYTLPMLKMFEADFMHFHSIQNEKNVTGRN